MRTYPAIKAPKAGQRETMRNYLARTRKEAGLSLREAAAMCAMAHSKLWLIEQGGHCEVDTLIDYCKAIGADPIYAMRLRVFELEID